MGARTNILIKYENDKELYIYSHWGGDGGLRDKLHKAMQRDERWDDPPYLTAIILREVLRNSLDSGTGYGVDPFGGEEEYTTTVVDTTRQTIDGVPYAEWRP